MLTILILIPSITSAQETKLGNVSLVYDGSNKTLTFINCLHEKDEIASDILLLDFQFWVNKPDSTIIVYGLNIPSAFVGDRYEMCAEMYFYKYNNTSCLQTKKYTVHFMEGTSHHKQLKITDDGLLQVTQNGQQFFEVRMSTLTEAGFKLIHNF